MYRGIQVTSEIGTLKKVLLHRPGRELLNLTPDLLEELLFDDIPYLKAAQEEHDAFAQILRDNGVEVVYLEDLMAEVIKDSSIRDKFIIQYLEEGLSDRRYFHDIYEYLNDFSDRKELVLKTMEGIHSKDISTHISVSLADMVHGTGNMLIKPMPNLYFTRDPFSSIGNGISLHRMYSETRRRETIYSEYIFDYHPDFCHSVAKYYDRYDPYHIEGGDILVLNEHTLAAGISQRTEANAVDFLAKHLFRDNDMIDTVYAFDIPKSRSFMHLDTVFTQIDKDIFTVHPEILGDVRVFKLSRSSDRTIKILPIQDHLDTILAEALNLDHVTLIPCGGNDSIAAQREQWNDGSNTLCIAPGVIVVYERNEVTNALLESYGIKVLKIPSSELSRGRGGPRCMSMPLWRDKL